MPEMRTEELWVGACMEAALPGVKVVQHDDGSRPRMYDLDLVRGGAVFAACEVTAAADAESIELWNLVNGSNERWIEQDLVGGWLITVAAKCRAKPLKSEIPALLRILENDRPGTRKQSAIARMSALGVVDAHRGGTAFPGSIYVTLERDAERTGGVVSNSGHGLVAWLDEWMRQPAQEHNLEKLRAGLLAKRHLFVLLPGFTTAPFTASDLLMRDEAPLPDEGLRLPPGITDVWLMSTWSTGDLFHYGSSGWSRSGKVFEVARD